MENHSFRRLGHPLSQIVAAEEVFANAAAFVEDEWEDIYKDSPPDEDEVFEWLNPLEVLGHLSACALRFELAGSDPDSLEIGEGYWTRRFRGSTMDVLFHSWLFQLKDRLEIDPRVIDHGFLYTDLVVIPDSEGIAAAAHELVLLSMGLERNVEERIRAEEKREARKYRRIEFGRVSKPQRGEGPRTSNPALADRVALALRDAGTSLKAEEVAHLLEIKNVASINTTLYQMAVKRAPKRLAGWILHRDDGRYEWVALGDRRDRKTN